MPLPLGLRDAPYVCPPLAASGVAALASEYSPYPVRTAAIHALEGDLVELFQPSVNDLLAQLFIGVYVVVYAVLLLFTYVGLKREGRSRHVGYATTYTIVVVAATPVFYFVPVGVTGYYLDGVEPLLYEAADIGTAITAVDTLRKALPSLHAARSITASLYAPVGYRLLSWTATGLVLLSTLYLGIHWLTDLVAGVALAYGCYRLTPVTLRAVGTIRGRLAE